MRTGLVVAILAVILLAVFNPGMDDFRLFVEDQSERMLSHEIGDSALGRALSGAGSSLAGQYVDRVTERDNYILFSVYTIDLDGQEEEGEEWKFLGAAGRFFQTQEPESFRQEE